MERIEVVPLSLRAKHILGYKPSIEGFRVASFIGILTVIAWLLSLASLFSIGTSPFQLLSMVIASALTAVTILVYRWKVNQIRRKIIKENVRDWELAQRVFAVQDELITNPPDPLDPQHPKMNELEGWKPFEVRFIPDESTVGDIAGAMEGTFYGAAFFGFRGAFQASIDAAIATETSPRLLGENVNVLLIKDGEILRVISPSIGLLKQMLIRAKEELSEGIEIGTHFLSALEEVFGDGPKSLLALFDSLNSSRFNDLMVVSLRFPLEDRPAVRINGLEVKPGVFLAFTAETEKDKRLALFPVNLLRELEKQFQDFHKGKMVLPQEPIRFLPGE